MKVTIFKVRLDSAHLIADQNLLNQFIETVRFIKSDTHFVETDSSYWSVIIHYEIKNEVTADLKTEVQTQESDLDAEQLDILQQLKVWRTDKASKWKIPSYMICHNSELIDIVLKRPDTIEEFKMIKEFGAKKSENHAEDILAVLNAL
jgi:superfamily II DNA helicase RecQ